MGHSTFVGSRTADMAAPPRSAESVRFESFWLSEHAMVPARRNRRRDPRPRQVRSDACNDYFGRGRGAEFVLTLEEH